MVKNQNDPRTMSLRSKNLKICRLSGNECAIFQRRTATGRRRTSNKVPFAPSPVSYTHLDVYKRQRHISATTGKLSKIPSEIINKVNDILLTDHHLQVSEKHKTAGILMKGNITFLLRNQVRESCLQDGCRIC